MSVDRLTDLVKEYGIDSPGKPNKALLVEFVLAKEGSAKRKD